MPKIQNVGGKIRYSVERFDGGLNTNASPADIAPFESPDCLNVTFDEKGAVQTRDGSAKWNTTAIGSAPIDWGISYNTTMIVWAGGTMYRTSGPSGTTFMAVTTSSGKFASGVRPAALVYQNILFASDGTNGPWKYTGGESFYNMGIDKPSAPTGACISAGSLSTGTYYYAVSFINSQVVEGEIGSASAGITITGSSTVRVSSIPVGSSLAGVDKRFVYRADAASGPFRKIGEIANNTTTTFDDTVANGAEGKTAVLDGTKPDAFKTITLHKERLFFDSAEDRTFIRYTDVANPFVAPAVNEEPMNAGDGEDIIAIASQDEVVTIFKKNRSFGLITNDPADDTTWQKLELPANIGIVGPKAFCKVQNGLIFVGRQNNKITGFHFLTGIRLTETSDGKLRSLTISERIEPTIFDDIDPSYWTNMALDLYDNRLFAAYTRLASTTNNRIIWFDLNRIGNNGQPGSWSLWDGINSNCFFGHNGYFFAGDATATGFVRRMNAGVFSDSGAAINSYFWTKEIGGQEEGILDSYIKDLREMYIWHERVGNFNMNVRVRVDGDLSNGISYPINLSQSSNTWGHTLWGLDVWGGSRGDTETRIPLPFNGRRFQLRFDNQNTVNQSFKVHRLELGFNIRRRR